jgi:glutamate-5-semialdehyde dehydrogenase
VSSAVDVDLKQYCEDVARRAKAATATLASLSTLAKNAWLRQSAKALRDRSPEILEANALDVAAAVENSLTPAAIDRLRLNEPRLNSIALGLEEVASLPDPIGETLEGSVRPNGLEVRKVRVPIGTVFFIYESRPNVTVDAAGICVKSGNAVILRGGKEARHSSAALVRVLTEAARRTDVPVDAIQLLETVDRAAITELLSKPDFIDVVIPRGGRGLIERVVAEARMPVIKHYDGNCHVYLDSSADPELAVSIVVNSKCQRMGVCNACESLIVHRAVAQALLPRIARELEARGVEMRCDEAALGIIPEGVAATEEDWSREYLGPTISIKLVDDLDAAIAHINHYGSHHTDAIVTQDLASARRFQLLVDSSAVVVNASTRLNDGGELGLGAEIGISTDKLHARGPCGLRELTTYKYLLTGNGHLRT